MVIARHFDTSARQQSERFVSSPDQKQFVAENADPVIHGNGPVQVSLPKFHLLLNDLVVKASKALGGRFPFNIDFQSGNVVGFSKDKMCFWSY